MMETDKTSPKAQSAQHADPGVQQVQRERSRRPSNAKHTTSHGHEEKSSTTSTKAQRPPLTATPSQMDTQYVNMLLALDGIPKIHNMMASFFTWILLAGFVLFPGTFSSLQGIQTNLGQTELQVLNAVQQVPLFIVAWICSGIGAVGMCYMWWRWMRNYVWLVNHIFLPGCLNALAGIISTLASVFGAQDGRFTTTSTITIAVTIVTAVICGILSGVYTFLIARVKRQHDQMVGQQKAGKHGEGVVEKIKRKAYETEPESGVV
ncbi:hypothetical protein EYR36_011694 [Pleurotus pulmonarius]|nr:hypothetical protein EYR36_011694 [Pleurotus pulmonarius]KAF4607402.1 hypothetical protein EYR38_001473 [Pleurotus pulmonarius]